MSKKDYTAIGDALRYLKKTSPFQEDWNKIIHRFVVIFQQDNPRFDASRFWDYVER